MKNKILLLAGFLVLASAFAVSFRKFSMRLTDPDRYYHFALSREMVQTGQVFLRSLPQVEDLGWGEFFVDKEFLFHQVTALGYRLGGDVGVEWGVILCGIGTILVLLLFAAKNLPPGAAVAATYFAISSPFLFSRLLMIRPHVLAVFAFTLMLAAVLARRPVATALAALFFTLSYHAFYLPLICLALLVPLSFLEQKKEAEAWRKVAYYGFFGCLCGILGNPYFPGSIDIAIIHAKIPSLFKGELAGLNWGEEHTPLRSDDFFEAFGTVMAAIAAAVFVLGYELRERAAETRRQRLPMLYLLGVSCFFFFLAFQSRRAGEYLAPTVGLLAVFLLQRLKKYRWLMLAIPLCLGLFQSRIFWRVLRYDQDDRSMARYEATKAALAELPPESKGKKIYNCEWDFTPFVIYFRPDLRFLDIMDPSLLYFAAKGPFRARDDLRKGFLADAHGMIHSAAKADYVLCNETPVNEQLRTDPGFQQLYPKGVSQATGMPALFKVREESPPEYVRGYFVSQLGPYKGKELPAVGKREDEKRVDLPRSTYLDLASYKGSMPDGLYCGLVRVAPDEVAKHAGASFATLGGGLGIELYRNRKPVFRAEPAYTYAKNVQVTVPLSPPLAKGEDLELLVCSVPGARYWGVTMALFTAKEMNDTCAWKSAKTGPSSTALDRGAWAFLGEKRSGCLGLLAAPVK